MKSQFVKLVVLSIVGLFVFVCFRTCSGCGYD